MRFWLDMGVDGLRLDAIPYLVERDGTNCENLPETHAVIKQIRARHRRATTPNRMLLAEANQWPTDVRPYFGDGDECHMAFHFPLMPRILHGAAPGGPAADHRHHGADAGAFRDNCQWGLFLRNHDELTLEMVTDDERDYMYLAYSADPRMRINVGIRRRLAPLMDNNRRRIELLNSLLFSFPGTPILYYGDEIGMGDNIYLGDRNGVRTPMQWNARSQRRLLARDPGAALQPGDHGSGLRLRGDQRGGAAERSVVAAALDAQHDRAAQAVSASSAAARSSSCIRRTARCWPTSGATSDEQILCVANLSRFAQPVELDLSAFEGMTPVEMLGYVGVSDRSDATPYRLTLGPLRLLWFELQRAAAHEAASDTSRRSTPAGPVCWPARRAIAWKPRCCRDF